MEISLRGRSAIITGGSEGLGRAMALRLSQSGADVAILARRPEVLEATRAVVAKTACGKVAAISCDVRDAAALKSAFQEVEATFGKVDILINNAGGASAKAFESVSDEDWQSDFELKLLAQARMSRLVLPGMRQRQWGRIVNVLNNMSRAPGANSAPTAVTRAAQLAAAKALSHEVAQFNITVNSLLVGLIRTEQMERFAQNAGAETPQEQDAFFTRLVAKVPMGRIGRPEEFAALACFLASEEASYITGVNINVDGGASPVG